MKVSKLLNQPPVRCSYTRLEPIDKLKPNPANPNKHSEAQLALYAKILRHQGWRKPIVVSARSGLIVCGHGAMLTAKAEGWQNVPVDIQEFESESDELAHLLADNKLPQLADLDLSEVAKMVKEIDGDLDLDLTGFSGSELDQCLAQLSGVSGVDAEPQIDRAAELQKEWKTKLGQVWQLGEHRLMCGSSSSEKDVALLSPVGFRMIWTDPPYGVSYGAKNKFLNAIARGNRIQTPIDNDQEDPADVERFTTEVFKIVCANAEKGAAIYVASPPGTLLPHFINAINNSGFTYKHALTWVKNQFVLGRCDYHYRHEMILYGWKENGAHYFTDNHGLDSVFEFDKPRVSNLHPTTKPTELVAACVNNSSKRGDLVYEPFSGSGTTIIACEQLGRRCRAMEISPAYVAVALQRYKDATGKTPVLL